METGKMLKRENGEAVAALMSAMVGLLVLGIMHLGSQASSGFNQWLLSVGQAWIPNATGIGPYSGKETFLLIGWLGSWAVLHLTLRNRSMRLIFPMVIFTAGLAVATLFVYTPFINFVLGK